jgi:HK97 gp10 family phage protein
MATTVSIRFEGVREFAKALRQLPDAVAAEALETALAAGAGPIRERATQLARRRSGKLAGSIRILASESTRASAAVSVGTKVKYAHLIEFGHRLVRGGSLRQGTGRVVGTVPAFPFLRPAVDEQRELILRRIGQVLGAQIEAAFRRTAPRVR